MDIPGDLFLIASILLAGVLLFVMRQLRKARNRQNEEEKQRRRIEEELDRQRMQVRLLDEIAGLLEDNVNNPLAIIAITSQNIRRRHEHDAEIIQWLNRIDAALRRIHATINDIRAFQKQKIVTATLPHVPHP